MGQILAPTSNTGRVSDEDDDGMDEEAGMVEAGGCCCCLVKMSPVVLCSCWISVRLSPSLSTCWLGSGVPEVDKLTEGNCLGLDTLAQVVFRSSWKIVGSSLMKEWPGPWITLTGRSLPPVLTVKRTKEILKDRYPCGGLHSPWQGPVTPWWGLVPLGRDWHPHLKLLQHQNY